jgi:hypothetical protein
MTYRAGIAIALLLLPALGRSVIFLGEACQFGPGYRWTDEVLPYEGPRLARVRPLLLPGARIGFLEDRYPRREHWWKYYVCQYVLAPVVIHNDPTLPIVLVNFRDSTVNPQPPPGFEYQLMADCGEGVRLYRARVDR